jgi:5-methylcytosine-specific restriction endonuclease McrA
MSPQAAPKVCHCGRLNCLIHNSKQVTEDRDRWRKRKENDPLNALYNCARWKATRRRTLYDANFICADCGGLANEADHRIDAHEWVASGHDFYDQSNLRALCKECHSSKTAKRRAK